MINLSFNSDVESNVYLINKVIFVTKDSAQMFGNKKTKKNKTNRLNISDL